MWVSRVEASAHKLERVYLALNGYRWDHFEAMVFVSEDYGKTWNDISANLPAEPVNVIKEDPENENVLYVGTDHGTYVSINRGQSYMAFVEGIARHPGTRFGYPSERQGHCPRNPRSLVLRRRCGRSAGIARFSEQE